MWDDSQHGHVKNFQASRDMFFMILKGYVLAAVAAAVNESCSTSQNTQPFCMISLKANSLMQSRKSSTIVPTSSMCKSYNRSQTTSEISIAKEWYYFYNTV